MNLARVIGHATATVKHRSMNGWRLVLTQTLDAAGKPEGDPFLAVDDLGSGVGSTVMITGDGPTVRKMMDSDDSPVRWAIIGISDE